MPKALPRPVPSARPQAPRAARHVAVAVASFGVTLGAGLLFDTRETVLSVVAPAPAEAATLASVPAPLAASRPAGAAAPAPGPVAALALPPPRALPGDGGPRGIEDLGEVVPVAFEGLDLGGPGDLAAVAPMGCALSLTAEPAPLAMADLAVEAPCAALGVVTIRHQGMAVDILADAEGRAAIRLPALAATATFSAEAGEESAAATLLVPEADQLDRAVLQWRGEGMAGLHAREFGAAYGAAGHVHAGAPGAEAAALAGEGGWLVALGDATLPNGRRAQVYTFPSGASRRDGSVDLTVEAEVTEATCGQAVVAQAIQASPGAAPFVTDLALALPGCDALGQWVVLEDALLDLRVASR